MFRRIAGSHIGVLPSLVALKSQVQIDDRAQNSGVGMVDCGELRQQHLACDSARWSLFANRDVSLLAFTVQHTNILTLETWPKMGDSGTVRKYRNFCPGSCFLVNRPDALCTHGVVTFFPPKLLTDLVLSTITTTSPCTWPMRCTLRS